MSVRFIIIKRTVSVTSIEQDVEYIFREPRSIARNLTAGRHPVKLNRRDSVQAADVGNRPQIKRFSSAIETFHEAKLVRDLFIRKGSFIKRYTCGLPTRKKRLGNNRNTRINMQICTRIFHAPLLLCSTSGVLLSQRICAIFCAV